MEQLNEDRDFELSPDEDYENHPKNRPFLFSENLPHPLILRRMVKRTEEEPTINDELLLNGEIYGFDTYSQDTVDKRNQIDVPFSGGFYG